MNTMSKQKMPPRNYTLGKRAAAVAQTRRAILEGAIRAYREHGFLGASMQAVARAADVAPGTVLYHFASPEELMGATIDRLLETLEPPDATLLDGVEDFGERMRLLLRELSGFYERSSSWVQPHEREKEAVPALREAEAAFYGQVEDLVRGALGPLADDDVAVAVTLTVADPGTSGALHRRGVPRDEATDVICDLLVPWLEKRMR